MLGSCGKWFLNFESDLLVSLFHSFETPSTVIKNKDLMAIFEHSEAFRSNSGNSLHDTKSVRIKLSLNSDGSSHLPIRGVTYLFLIREAFQNLDFVPLFGILGDNVNKEKVI